jgi:quercetin dioxygenase-like cupin family protein
MKITHHSKIESKTVEMEGAASTQVRWLIGQADGAANFAMRMFEIAPGGHTPRHQHDYEHEIYVLEGEGIAVEGDQQHALKAGDVVYVHPNDIHQFRNDGNAPVKMLCLIPNAAYGKDVKVVPECGVEPAAS